MREYDRTVLLERLEREGATIGATMPSAVEVDAEVHAVRAPVLDLVDRDELSDSDRERAQALARTLRRARSDRVNRLRTGDLDFDAGEAVVDEVAGIDRALNALGQLDAPGLAEQVQERERVDSERWLAFLREALSHDQGRRR